MATPAFDSEVFEAVGLPDGLAGVVRILERGLGSKMTAALLLCIEGSSLRKAAKAVGLATHQDVHRELYALGLRDLHKSRAAERKRVIECVRQAGADPRIARLPVRELVRML